MSNDDSSRAKSFAEQAQGKQKSFLGEIWGFMKHNKKWWLTPIIIALLLLSAVLILGSTGAGPLIYTLF